MKAAAAAECSNYTHSSNFSETYSEKNFWEKVQRHAAAIGRRILEGALVLYYALNDPDVPVYAKASIIAALGYLISPIDAIPDVIPIIGYSDDAGVITAVLALIKAYLKEEHRQRARAKVEELFG